MTRRTNTRLAAVAAATLIPVLPGCGHDTEIDSTSQSPTGPDLHVEATFDVKKAGVIVPTTDRLWVITPLSGTVTQVDPKTNKVVKVVSLPHPAGYAALSHGSLWLVSTYFNAMMEVDAKSGTVLRTLERSPDLPLSYPVGIAATEHDLWVLGHDNAKLLRIDARTGAVTHTTSLAGRKAAGPYLVDGSLWVAMTKEGIVDQVDPADGEVVGKPIPVETGLCSWGSVVGTDILFTSTTADGFNCRNGTSRLDARSREVSPLAVADGTSLYSFTRYHGSLWATDSKRTLYQVDGSTGALRPVMTLPGKPDTNHLFTAFGSMWMTRYRNGQLLRLEIS